jgi:hypothetical protein
MNKEYATTIKSDINSTPTDILNRCMDTFSNNEYIFNAESYIGIVVDNNDPEKLGRCRIMVYTIFDTIPTEHLPWAVPDFSFVGSSKGSFIVPTVGTIVSVYFGRGEIYLPHYTTKILNTRQLPTNKDVDYPDNMVFFETEQGDSFELNRRRNTATYTHATGTKISIDSDGSVNIISVANITTNHEDDLTVNGNTVTPTGIGPLCAIPKCPFSGAWHTGTVCTSISTVPTEGDVSGRPGLGVQ